MIIVTSGKEDRKSKSKKSCGSENASPEASSGEEDVEKKRETKRNMSSADRSYRQAGRNNRRGCNYEVCFINICLEVLIT